MSRILFVTWDGAGNLVPTFGLARALTEKGHDVRLLGHRTIQERCGEHGWRFRPFRHTPDFDSTAPTDIETEMQSLGRQLFFNPSVVLDVQEELRREPSDVLIVDCMLFAALCAGEAAEIPTIALFHTPVSPFRLGPMVEAMGPAMPVLNALRAELGLATVATVFDLHDACALSLVTSATELEAIPMPPNVRFVGPMAGGPSPLPDDDDVPDVADGPQPLVLVSLSTSYQDQVGVLGRLVEALAAVPARVVVTTGPAVDPGMIRDAANIRVRRFVRHDRLLPQASLFVTHAGLGSVLTALRHGVPMLCVPMGRDQYFNAGRVEALGASRTISADAGADVIAETVRELLGGGTEREGAKRMANILSSYGGIEEAVAEVERIARS